MPIHGTIEEAGLPDVLQLLALGRKSGCLAVADGESQGEIYLDMGRVSYASVANRDRLGELLVKSGRITREQLSAATEEQGRNSKRKIGRILLDSGHIDRGELEKVVRRQVQEAVYTLFTWKQGSFTFSSDRQPTRGALLVSLDADSLLLEGARRVDEWDQISRKIPSFDLIFQKGRAPRTDASEELTEEQRRVLALLDGQRDITTVAEMADMDEFDAAKALYGLVVAGFARLVERRAAFRHLDYRELLAYVVREAEFADGERRKLAARHIVDCPACSERLRTIHVRRTEGHQVITEEMVRAATPVKAPSEAPTIPTPAVKPRRRSSDAKRADEASSTTPTMPTPVHSPRTVTRAPAEGAPDQTIPVVPSRQEILPAAAAASPPAEAGTTGPRVIHGRREEDRRASDRRHGDRRRPEDRRQVDRRSGFDRRQLMLAAWEQANPERRAKDRRAHHDRRVPDRRRHNADARPAAPPAAPAAPVIVEEATPVSRLTYPRQMAPAELPPEPAPRSSPSPAGDSPDGRSKEIIWLMSPEQATAEMRAARNRRAAESPPATPRPAAVSDPDVPKGQRPSIAALVPPFISAPSRDVPMPVPSSLPTPKPQRVKHPRTLPARNIAIAAALGGVMLLAYSAGRMGGRAPSGQVPQETALTQSANAAPVPPHNRPPEVAARGPAQHQAAPAPAPAPPPATPPIQLAARPQPTTLSSVQRVAPPPASPTLTSSQAAQVPPAAAPPAAPPSAPAAIVAAPAPAPAPPPAPAPAPPPAPAPTATEPDRELAAGGWAPIERAEAVTVMGGALAAIQGLSIESISRSTTGNRPRIRVTQLTPSGERIVLTVTKASAAAGPGAPTITALRVMPASEAYPMSTGTVSMGNLLITARSSIDAEALHAQLEKLGHIQ